MTIVELEDLCLVFAVSLMHAYQIAYNAKMVGFYRTKHKVPPPEMTGPPELVRVFRSQQNDLEFALPFQVLLWTCGVCFNQVVAAVLGIAFIYYRHAYKIGYIEDPKKRVKPFHGSVNVIKIMLPLCIAGIVTLAVRRYLHVDLAVMAKKQVYPLVGLKDEL